MRGLAWLLCCAACAAPEVTPSDPMAGAPRGDAAEEACLALAARGAREGGARPDRIKLSQVLVHHAAAKRPKEGVSRTRGQACLRAAEARDKLLAGAPFDEVVASYSDEAGAATRAGMVGEVTPGELDPALAGPAFELERGQMSDVVESPFGFHLLLRNE